ncbi:MAG: hypothetical protein KAX38_02040, partial [Candidatus Krumholzibacteria bacterium]|nr:hypothetical protein [Candidatus Krumholzibacteria bacterium]
MLRNLLCVCLAAALISTAAEAAETQRFELLSRTLIQGPAKTAAFFQAGLVLGTGGGIVVLSPADSLGSLSFITVEGIPNEIVVRGNIAFIAAMRGGLIVIDLSDPKKPREIYNHRMKRANTCSISGNYIFVADFHSRKLYTFELTNLLDPKLEETRKLHIPAISLTSDRDLLAVVTTRNAEIFRVQENGALVRLSEVNSPVSLKKGLLKQGILYLITSDGEVLRWNLGSPAKPRRLPSITKEEIIDLAV